MKDQQLWWMFILGSTFGGVGGVGGLGGGGGLGNRASSPMNVGSARMSPSEMSSSSPRGGGGASSSSSTTGESSSPFNRDTLREKVREIPIKVMRGAASTLNNGATTTNNNNGNATAAAAAGGPRMSMSSNVAEGSSPRQSPARMGTTTSSTTVPPSGASGASAAAPSTDHHHPRSNQTGPYSASTPTGGASSSTEVGWNVAAPNSPLPAVHDPSIPIPLPPSFSQVKSETAAEDDSTGDNKMDDQQQQGQSTSAGDDDDAAAKTTTTTTEDDAQQQQPKKAAVPATALDVIEDVREKTREFGLEIAALKPGELAKTDKQYLYLEEMLMRQLIRLDNVETEGKDEVRMARKQAVKEIQATISKLEAIGVSS